MSDVTYCVMYNGIGCHKLAPRYVHRSLSDEVISVMILCDSLLVSRFPVVCCGPLQLTALDLNYDNLDILPLHTVPYSGARLQIVHSVIVLRSVT